MNYLLPTRNKNIPAPPLFYMLQKTHHQKHDLLVCCLVIQSLMTEIQKCTNDVPQNENILLSPSLTFLKQLL